MAPCRIGRVFLVCICFTCMNNIISGDFRVNSVGLIHQYMWKDLSIQIIKGASVIFKSLLLKQHTVSKDLGGIVTSGLSQKKENNKKKV